MNGLHGIIFSYEKRRGLRELEEIRSAASIPFGGRYRAVDFSLSNLVNAGVTDVGIVLHGRYQSMLDHLGTGKVWGLSRKRGGLRILPPFNYRDGWGVMPYRGKIEALASSRSYLDTIRQDHVVLMDGDLVANLPLADIYESHMKSGADITVVCGNDSFHTENGTYFERDGQGRVTEVLFNLHTPRGYRGLEVYILFGTDLQRRSAPFRNTLTAVCSCWTRRSGQTCSHPSGRFGPRVRIRAPPMWGSAGTVWIPWWRRAAILRERWRTLSYSQAWW